MYLFLVLVMSKICASLYYMDKSRQMIFFGGGASLIRHTMFIAVTYPLIRGEMHVINVQTNGKIIFAFMYSHCTIFA